MWKGHRHRRSVLPLSFISLTLTILPHLSITYMLVSRLTESQLMTSICEIINSPREGVLHNSSKDRAWERLALKCVFTPMVQLLTAVSSSVLFALWIENMNNNQHRVASNTFTVFIADCWLHIISHKCCGCGCCCYLAFLRTTAHDPWAWSAPWGHSIKRERVQWGRSQPLCRGHLQGCKHVVPLDLITWQAWVLLLLCYRAPDTQACLHGRGALDVLKYIQRFLPLYRKPSINCYSGLFAEYSSEERQSPSHKWNVSAGTAFWQGQNIVFFT